MTPWTFLVKYTIELGAFGEHNLRDWSQYKQKLKAVGFLRCKKET